MIRNMDTMSDAYMYIRRQLILKSHLLYSKTGTPWLYLTLSHRGSGDEEGGKSHHLTSFDLDVGSS